MPERCCRISRTVAVPGAVTVVAALAGGSLLGVLGALLAIPILAFTVAFLRALRHPEERANPTE